MKKLRYIDALRGLAVLGVLVVHCSKAGKSVYPFMVENILNFGAMGVQLFFVISACTLFLSAHKRSKEELHPRTNFFIRRFFRIAPLYYLAIIYYLWQNGTAPNYWTGYEKEVSGWMVGANFFFLHGLNPYSVNSLVPGGWSISAEMLFYCLVPLLAVKIRNLNAAILFLAGCLVFKTGFDLVLTSKPLITNIDLWNSFLYFSLPSQLPVFALGFIMYFLIFSPEDSTMINRKYLLGLAMALILQLSLGYNVQHIMFALLAVIMGYALSVTDSKILVNRFTVYVGKLSFSMYLIHFAVLFFMEKFGWLEVLPAVSGKNSLVNFAFRMAVLLPLSMIGSSITYYGIELPTQRAGKWLIRKIEGKA